MRSAVERPEWRFPFSVADESVIDGLDDATRAVVERYRRCPVYGDLKLIPKIPDVESACSYLEDAVDECNRALSILWRITR